MDITQYFTEFFSDLTSSEWQWHLIAINLSVIFGLLFFFKFKIAWITGVSIKEELTEKDNPAFGYVLAGAFLSFFLIMGAASTGDDMTFLRQEVELMLSYGVSGIIMLLISKVVFDNIAMSSFCLSDQIRKRNTAAAFIDASNMIATALIIFTYMSWVKGTGYGNLLIVAYGWVISQFSLSILSFIRGKIFKSKKGKTLQDAIKNGNMAVAIRYSSYKLSFAFTSLIASVQYPYNEAEVWWYATSIFLASILLSFAITLLTMLAKKIILPSIDFQDEINEQNNYGLASIEAAIVMGITIASYTLLL